MNGQTADQVNIIERTHIKYAQNRAMENGNGYIFCIVSGMQSIL